MVHFPENQNIHVFSSQMKHARNKVDVTERLVSIYLWYKVCQISDPEKRYYELDVGKAKIRRTGLIKS